METPRQSNGNAEKCSEANIETASQSTNLCQLENTTESDENKITNELNSDKYVLFCTTCHLQLSGTNREQHKLHDVKTLQKAADDARKRLEDLNKSVQLENKACLDKIKEYENTRLTTEDLHRVVDSEFDRISKALNESLESVKEQRESQYKNYLQDLKKTKSSLEQNIETMKTKQKETEYILDIDLLCKEDSLTKEIRNFQNSINIPSFDVAGELVENSLIQALYSKKEKEKIEKKEKEHGRLRIKKEFFENAFEDIMTLLNSLVKYRENKNETIHSSELPKIPDQSLRKKMRERRRSANFALKVFKNIAIELIDFERTKEEEENDLERKKEQEIDSDKDRITEDVTYKSATGEIKEVTEIDEFKKVKVQKEQMKNVIKTIGRWINVCHRSVEQGEIDQDELTVPSEQLFGKTGMEKLEYIRRNLEDIRQHIKQLKEEISSTSKQLEETEKETKAVKLEREQRLSKKAGSKLTDNNPGITDLSDPNRLTRLAEMFGEIYDNVWTDTIEGLIEKKRIKTEKEAVLHMASILKVCYIYCENKFEETLEQMEGVLLLKSQKKSGDVELDKKEQKQLKGMLKTMGVRTSKCLDQDDLIKCVTDRNLQKAMQKQAVTKDFTEDMQKHQAVTKDFTKQCLEICWLMVIQDPPVVLYWGDSTVGSPIDADRFKAFTRSGDSLEYIVWPAVLLHTNGPLLNKGIVQPEELDTKP